MSQTAAFVWFILTILFGVFTNKHMQEVDNDWHYQGTQLYSIVGHGGCLQATWHQRAGGVGGRGLQKLLLQLHAHTKTEVKVQDVHTHRCAHTHLCSYCTHTHAHKPWTQIDRETLDGSARTILSDTSRSINRTSNKVTAFKQTDTVTSNLNENTKTKISHILNVATDILSLSRYYCKQLYDFHLMVIFGWL